MGHIGFSSRQVIIHGKGITIRRKSKGNLHGFRIAPRLSHTSDDRMTVVFCLYDRKREPCTGIIVEQQVIRHAFFIASCLPAVNNDPSQCYWKLHADAVPCPGRFNRRGDIIQFDFLFGHL